MAKTFVAEHFKKAAAHHASLATHHSNIAKAAEAARTTQKAAASKSDIQGLDIEALDNFFQQFIEEHSALSDECMQFAEHCADCASAKADAGGDLEKMASGPALELLVKRIETIENTIVPTGVSAIIPRAVTRAGQRELPETANVPEQFRKLVSVEHYETLPETRST
ncbi:MAG TPA: hypothetical protein VGI46_06850 [Candidatus Acidoferrum sp.]|jgi:hypothetical protein